MKVHQKCIYLLVIVISSLGNVSASRVRDMLYVPIDGAAACFRRSNGTHQFGCSSSRSGNVGAIHYVESEADVEWLETKATASPYIVVSSFSMFNRDVLLKFKNSASLRKKVNGVLLMRNLSSSNPPMYSPDDKCPNRYSGYSGPKDSCSDQWNPWGSSLLLEDWPFPMFYLEDQDDLQKIRDCYLKYNAHDKEKQSDRSLCALEMNSFMYSGRNSETCYRRSSTPMNLKPMTYCDPLGDKNIHWPLAPISDVTKSVILVIARLDADSMFDNLVPGAGSAVTGLVTLLATAAYLNSLNPVIGDVDVVFSLLNGEAFDYIGSSRLIYDLQNGKFDALGGKTLKFEQISHIIELGQLGDGQIYLHTPSRNENDPLALKLEKELNATLLTDSYPPASVQRFLRVNGSLSTVVIANHGQTFTNRYYNSILDDAENLGYSSNNSDNKISESLAKVATKLGEVLYNLVNRDPKPLVSNGTAVHKVVSDLLPCYLESAKCRMFQAAFLHGLRLEEHLMSLYVRVSKHDNILTVVTANVLKLLTGEYYPNIDASSCAEKHLSWLPGYEYTGVCINSTVNYSLAASPAFEIPGYDMKSGMYSTWTESIWDNLEMRMFLRAPPLIETYSFIIGFVVTFVSVLVIYFAHSRADVLYSSTSVDL
ncbi:hypothetical protein QAD02_005793 [Eretmocerus hayati]|uniref:Uncharacterized protein n=1 Tax=Eretmocerus hayati TaxID=131215 RepID=A0ACC2NV91_9HYME|nr:hypothetical protein QAD02_005793 [Eretmocerus hayati]